MNRPITGRTVAAYLLTAAAFAGAFSVFPFGALLLLAVYFGIYGTVIGAYFLVGAIRK